MTRAMDALEPVLRATYFVQGKRVRDAMGLDEKGMRLLMEENVLPPMRKMWQRGQYRFVSDELREAVGTKNVSTLLSLARQKRSHRQTQEQRHEDEMAKTVPYMARFQKRVQSSSSAVVFGEHVHEITDLVHLSGIYMVFKEAEVVYVGKSVNVLSRLGSHHVVKPGDCRWDRVFLVEMDPSNETAMSEVEFALIRLLNPARNGRQGRSAMSLEEAEAALERNLTPEVYGHLRACLAFN